MNAEQKSNTLDLPLISSEVIVFEYHFFDFKTKTLVTSNNEISKVPESLKYDLKDLKQAERHLIEIGFINPLDCLISFV